MWAPIIAPLIQLLRSQRPPISPAPPWLRTPPYSDKLPFNPPQPQLMPDVQKPPAPAPAPHPHNWSRNLRFGAGADPAASTFSPGFNFQHFFILHQPALKMWKGWKRNNCTLWSNVTMVFHKADSLADIPCLNTDRDSNTLPQDMLGVVSHRYENICLVFSH